MNAAVVKRLGDGALQLPGASSRYRFHMSKRFRHLGQEWEAFGTGTGHGVGAGILPPINRWGVVFRSVTQPDRGDYRGGSISAADPAKVSEAELKSTLEEQLVTEAINRSRYIWRPAEAISRETGIPVERVRHILENTASDVLGGSRNQQGLWLYTTREHLANTASSTMRQFFDVEESS